MCIRDSPWTSQRQALGTGTDRYGGDVAYTVTSATADRVASGTQHSEFRTCNDPISSMSAQYGSSHTYSLTSGFDDASLTVCTGMYIADDAIYTSGTRSRSESAGFAVHTRTSSGTSSRPRMSPIHEHTSSVRPRPDTAYALRSAPEPLRPLRSLILLTTLTMTTIPRLDNPPIGLILPSLMLQATFYVPVTTQMLCRWHQPWLMR